MAYLIGAILGAAICAGAQLVGFEQLRNFYPICLIVIASYYELFAAISGSPSAMWLEAVGFGAFALLAIVGFHRSRWLICAGLVGHGMFDAVHGPLIGNSGVPLWWPAFCLAFDVAMGACLAIRMLPPRLESTGRAVKG